MSALNSIIRMVSSVRSRRPLLHVNNQLRFSTAFENKNLHRRNCGDDHMEFPNEFYFSELKLEKKCKDDDGDEKVVFVHIYDNDPEIAIDVRNDWHTELRAYSYTDEIKLRYGDDFYGSIQVEGVLKDLNPLIFRDEKGILKSTFKTIIFNHLYKYNPEYKQQIDDLDN